jgi:hypothetical protein
MFEVFTRAEWKDKTVSKRFSDIRREGVIVLVLVKSFSVTKLLTIEEEFITTLNKAFSRVEEEQ